MNAAVGGLGWALAAALAAGWVLRSPGEFEVWVDHRPVGHNLPLNRALAECARLWSGRADHDVRAVVRRGGRVVCAVDWRAEAAVRRALSGCGG